MKPSANPIHPDIEMLQVVARALDSLRDQVTFVGGATTTLYIDDPAAPLSVATQDVDCVVELTNLLSFEILEKKLRKRGFQHPVNDTHAPICRWILGEIIVDIMPSNSKILGFSNRWYQTVLPIAKCGNLPMEHRFSFFQFPILLQAN